jgi:putative endonuclease
MYYVYALYSVEYNKIYIGFATDLEKRLAAHNHLLNKGYTAKFKPWIIIYTESCVSKKKALIREKQLKTAKGRTFIKSIIPK